MDLGNWPADRVCYMFRSPANLTGAIPSGRAVSLVPLPIRRATDLGSHLNMSTNDEKKLAAEAAAELVENGMTVGLGAESTVAFLLPALAAES